MKIRATFQSELGILKQSKKVVCITFSKGFKIVYSIGASKKISYNSFLTLRLLIIFVQSMLLFYDMM